MIVNNNVFNEIAQKVKTSVQTKETNEINETSNVPKEEYENKKEPAGRYNFLTANGWLDNSPLVKDEKLNAAFRDYVDNMPEDEYLSLLTSMAKDFAPGFGNNINNLPLHEAPSKKDPNIELSSLSSIKKYFTDNYNEVISNTAKWGGDTTNAVNTLVNLLDFFNNYESKQQENQYLSLGKAK